VSSSTISAPALHQLQQQHNQLTSSCSAVQPAHSEHPLGGATNPGWVGRQPSMPCMTGLGWAGGPHTLLLSGCRLSLLSHHRTHGQALHCDNRVGASFAVLGLTLPHGTDMSGGVTWVLRLFFKSISRWPVLAYAALLRCKGRQHRRQNNKITCEALLSFDVPCLMHSSKHYCMLPARGCFGTAAAVPATDKVFLRDGVTATNETQSNCISRCHWCRRRAERESHGAQ
jgi:hypothetical protein